MPWILVESAVRTAAQNAAAQNSMLNLSFHGGDAGACWDLFRRTVEFARRLCGELGIKAHLSTGTNAYYTPDQADYIAANIDEATVSFDGLPEIHDRFRCAPDGSGSCDKLLECLQRFDQTGFSYSIRMTVLKESVERLPESVDFICRHSKAKLIRAEPLYLRGRALAAHLQSPPPDLFVEKFREARAIAEQHKRALSYSGARIGTIIGTFCSYAHPTFGVTPEGHLTCCYEVLDKSDPLADSFFYGRMDPVTGILAVDQDRIDRIRRMATLRKEQCADCFCVAHCAGDCGAKATGESSATGVPERCIITREITKDQMRDYLRRGMVHLKS